MKSFKKLISFNNHRSKEKRESALSQESLDPKLIIEEDAKDMQDLSDMRRQYEGLCSISSLVSTRAAEFSAAMNELAEYFINTFGAIEDGEMSKVFKIVGRVQFEISKILDVYAVHVAETITEPTENLLSELRNVQDSKTQHDEKRQLYDQLRARMLKGRPKGGKGDAFADQQLQLVKDEFDKLSLFVNTRLDSLEQGQARSMITQAARHHTAQMHLFSRGHSSLQAVEPYMRQVARERTIDRHLSTGGGGPNDDSDSKSDVSYIEEADDSSGAQSLEQSNRWGSRADSPGRSPNDHVNEQEVPKNLSKEWNSLLSKLSHSNGENSHGRSGDGSGSRSFKKEQAGSSGRRNASSHQGKHLRLDAVQVTEVVDDAKPPQSVNPPSSPPLRPPPELPASSVKGYNGVGFRNDPSEGNPATVSTSGRAPGDRHSASDADHTTVRSMQNDSSGLLSKNGHGSLSPDAFHSNLSTPAQKLQESTGHPSAMGNPPFLSFISPMLTSTPAGFTSSSKDSSGQMKRYSQSGPLTFSGTPWSGSASAGNPGASPGQPAMSADVHKSGPLGRSPLGRTFGSPRISPSMSPPRMSPPRISELHKLPPPPLNPVNTKKARSPPLVAHSAPLSRRPEPQGHTSANAIPLPPPPLGSVPRSLSLPSRQRQQRSKVPTISHLAEVDEEGSPTSTTTNSSASPRLSGSGVLAQAQAFHKRLLSGNGAGQDAGLPPSDLKFVPLNSSKSVRGTPTLSSQYRRPPSPRGGKDKLQQSDRADSGSYPITPLKSGGVQNSPRWRSLSINDKDSYAQNMARAVGSIQRDFPPEIVALNPT